MKNKLFAVVIAIAAILAFSGCTQQYLIPVPDHGSDTDVSASKPADTRSLFEALDARLPKDIKKVMEGGKATGLERVADEASAAASRSGEDSYKATFRFNGEGYAVTGYGTIYSGTFTVDFKGTSTTEAGKETFTSNDLTMDFESIGVLKDGEVQQQTVTVTGLTSKPKTEITIVTDTTTKKVTVSDLDTALSITQSLTTETTITVDNVNVPVKDVAEAETPTGPFAGGFGTEAFPYIIKTPEQFMEIADYESAMLAGDYLYFDVESDLDFRGRNEVGILKFRGELDFNGNEVRGISSDQLRANFYTLIDDIIEGKISNLEYRPDDMIPLAYTCGWSDATSSRDEWITSFNNVNVYGDFRNISNNVSLYIIQAFKGSLEFHDCTSDVFATGDSYDGVFLGGYPQKYTERLVFDNCVNKGTLIVKNAGLFTGNSTYTPVDVIVTDCRNEGFVIGTESSGVYCGLNVTSDAIKKLNDELKPIVSGSDDVYTRDSAIEIAYDDSTKQVAISNSGEAATFRISGSLYTRMATSNYEDEGTLLVSFDMEGEFNGSSAVASFPAREVVDYIYAEKNNGVAGVDENGNDIVTIGDETYYLVTERHPYADDPSVTAVIVNGVGSSEHVVGKLSTYSVFAYDADGIPVGYQKLDI